MAKLVVVALLPAALGLAPGLAPLARPALTPVRASAPLMVAIAPETAAAPSAAVDELPGFSGLHGKAMRVEAADAVRNPTFVAGGE